MTNLSYPIPITEPDPESAVLQWFTLLGELCAAIDYDTAEGIFRLLLSDEQDPVNIGNPDEFTVRELAELVLELTGSTSEITTVPLPFSDDPKQRKPVIEKAQRILGWEPTIALRDGLAPTIEYLRGEVLQNR